MIIKTDPAVIAGYLEDASGFTAGRAERLVIPEHAGELSAYLAEATQRREAVTVSGGGTGVTAGRIPRGGTLLSLERFTELGAVTRTARGGEIRVDPAVRLADLKSAAAAEGLLYGPDPTEWTGTLGGNAATNASGGQSFKYGPTRAHVRGLTVVLATGGIVSLRRGECRAQGDRLVLPLRGGGSLPFDRPRLKAPQVEKNAAGFFSAPDMDAVDLFIGMEGTLGVISSLILDLLPAPRGVLSLACFFRQTGRALETAAAVRASVRGGAPRPGIAPASLEYLDRRALALLRPVFPNLPVDAESCLMVDQEWGPDGETAALEAWAGFLEEVGVPERNVWSAADAAGRERLRRFRHALPERVNEIVRSRRFPKVGTDLAVPSGAFDAMYDFYESGLQACGLDALIFGHIGDCHLHVNVLPRTAEEYQRARELYLGFACEAVRLGGTISAEHGVGKLKHDYLHLMIGKAGMQELARVKRVLDPAGILNRDNVLPERWLET